MVLLSRPAVPADDGGYRVGPTLGRPLGYLIFSLMALTGDPMY